MRAAIDNFRVKLIIDSIASRLRDALQERNTPKGCKPKYDQPKDEGSPTRSQDNVRYTFPLNEGKTNLYLYLSERLAHRR